MCIVDIVILLDNRDRAMFPEHRLCSIWQIDKKKCVLNRNKKIKIGLFTNEIPPIVYGGVATWILNFMEMFKNDNDYEVVPIYLATNDKPHQSFFSKYKGCDKQNKRCNSIFYLISLNL